MEHSGRMPEEPKFTQFRNPKRYVELDDLMPVKGEPDKKEPIVLSKKPRMNKKNGKQQIADQRNVDKQVAGDVAEQMEKIEISKEDELVNEEEEDTECEDDDVDSNAESFEGNEYPDEDNFDESTNSSDSDGTDVSSASW